MLMLKEERQRLIRQIVDSQGQVTVAGLSHQFGVTEMTIRRDLQDLDEQGRIRRIHGGAISIETRSPIDLPVLERVKQKPIIKRRIGQAVANMIEDGERFSLLICVSKAEEQEEWYYDKKEKSLHGTVNDDYEITIKVYAREFGSKRIRKLKIECPYIDKLNKKYNND